jgi:hypothetical protein
MKQTRQRLILFALFALLALFAGCKGESPTAPPPVTGTTGGGGTGSGSTQPPVGATVVLTASSLTPFTSSTSTITATVTQNNSPVPNGTAVQFSTTALNANFTDTSDNPTTLIRTTTAGVAKVTVTASTAGPVIVNATVNNVTKSITVTFQDVSVLPPPPSNAPVITSITPATGLPTGNQAVTITGSNFRAPVLVLFDPGNGQAAKSAFATLVTANQINVITPAFDLGVSQQLVVAVTVIVEAGLPTEQRVTKASAFTYTAPVLTPVVRALSPTAGPIDGGTRVSIIGDAFEAPVQVFFGSAQVTVLTVTFHEIDVVSPSARDTNANGSGAVTGPVDVKVVDVNSGKSVVATGAFRYVNKAQITAISPDQGPFIGGTRFTIDGTGFVDPVTVSLDGVAASVIKVSGTQIIGISSGIALTGCADSNGPIVVTNVDNGDSATGPTWIYRILKPAIVAATPGTVGGNATVTVLNAIGTPIITIGGIGAQITGSVVNGDGTTTFTVLVPAGVTLQTVSCPAGGTAPIPTPLPVAYKSLATTCDTSANGISNMVISPQQGPILFVNGVFSPFTGTITPANPSATPPTPASVAVSPPSETVALVNNGSNLLGTTPLTITSFTTTNAGGNGCAAFSISTSRPVPANLDQCDAFAVSASYNATLVPTVTPDQCIITIGTNVGSPRVFTVSGSTH